jgi:hypothetical protein
MPLRKWLANVSLWFINKSHKSYRLGDEKIPKYTQEIMGQTFIFNDEGFLQGMKGMSVKR